MEVKTETQLLSGTGVIEDAMDKDGSHDSEWEDIEEAVEEVIGGKLRDDEREAEDAHVQKLLEKERNAIDITHKLHEL